MPFQPNRLKSLREAKDMSQEQLGRIAGLSHSVIAKSENGKNLPRSDALDKLAGALDCTIDYLHGRGPDYDNARVAASQMAFDIAQRILTDEQRERCRRVLHHPDAPRTADAWRSLAEMTDLAVGTAVPATPIAVLEQRPKPKPMASTPRRPNSVRKLLN